MRPQDATSCSNFTLKFPITSYVFCLCRRRILRKPTIRFHSSLIELFQWDIEFVYMHESWVQIFEMKSSRLLFSHLTVNISGIYFWTNSRTSCRVLSSEHTLLIVLPLRKEIKECWLPTIILKPMHPGLSKGELKKGFPESEVFSRSETEISVKNRNREYGFRIIVTPDLNYFHPGFRFLHSYLSGPGISLHGPECIVCFSKGIWIGESWPFPGHQRIK